MSEFLKFWLEFWHFKNLETLPISLVLEHSEVQNSKVKFSKLRAWSSSEPFKNFRFGRILSLIFRSLILWFLNFKNLESEIICGQFIRNSKFVFLILWSEKNFGLIFRNVLDSVFFWRVSRFKILRSKTVFKCSYVWIRIFANSKMRLLSFRKFTHNFSNF